MNLTIRLLAIGERLRLAAICALAVLMALNSRPAAAQVMAMAPYTVSVFATSVTGVYTQPDSITTGDGFIFIGYGNGVATNGSDGKSSTIVQYTANGDVVQTFSVKGHNDGLKFNPRTKLLWALQNEDGNPNLVTIDPLTASETVYDFAVPTAHGGGYDDVAFRGDDVYISASNPSNNPNTAQAIVKATLSGANVVVTPVLLGNAIATDIPAGAPVQLNLQDPDSLIVDPNGDLVLDSQADSELIIVHHPGASDQSVFHLPLSSGGVAVQVDDTVFATATEGVILVADRDGETVYSIQAPFFAPNDAYSAAPAFVGRLDMHTGVLTPVVSGLVSAHGMRFISR